MIIFSTADIEGATFKSGNCVELSGWVMTIISDNKIIEKMSPSTKYYIRYDIGFVREPYSHTYTTQAWAQTNLYSSTYGSISCLGITQSQYLNLHPGNIISKFGEFNTPSTLSGYRMVFYSARFSTDSATWGTDAEIVPVRLYNFEISNTPFEISPINIDKKGIVNSKFYSDSQRDTIVFYKESIDCNNIYEY